MATSGHHPPPPAAHLPHDSNTHHQSWPQHDIASLQEHQTANSMKPELPTTWLQPTPSICSHTLINPEEGLLLHACSTAPVHAAPPAHFYMRLSTVGGILLPWFLKCWDCQASATTPGSWARLSSMHRTSLSMQVGI